MRTTERQPKGTQPAGQQNSETQHNSCNSPRGLDPLRVRASDQLNSARGSTHRKFETGSRVTPKLNPARGSAHRREGVSRGGVGAHRNGPPWFATGGRVTPKLDSPRGGAGLTQGVNAPQVVRLLVPTHAPFLPQHQMVGIPLPDLRQHSLLGVPVCAATGTRTVATKGRAREQHREVASQASTCESQGPKVQHAARRLLRVLFDAVRCLLWTSFVLRGRGASTVHVA